MIANRLLVAPLRGVLIRRSMAYWVLLHMAKAVVIVMMALAAGIPMDPAALPPGGNPLVVALVPVLGMVEARRRNEDLFLANLGYGRRTMAAYFLAPAAVLEAVSTIVRFGWAGLGG